VIGILTTLAHTTRIPAQSLKPLRRARNEPETKPRPSRAGQAHPGIRATSDEKHMPSHARTASHARTHARTTRTRNKTKTNFPVGDQLHWLFPPTSDIYIYIYVYIYILYIIYIYIYIYIYIGVRDCPYGICYPWVRGGWDLDALGKFFRRRRRRRSRPLLFRHILEKKRNF
jgi:hypothetical protein